MARSATILLLSLQGCALDARLEQDIFTESRALEEGDRFSTAHFAILVNVCDSVPAVEEIYFCPDLSHLRSFAAYSAGEGQYKCLLGSIGHRLPALTNATLRQVSLISCSKPACCSLTHVPPRYQIPKFVLV